MTNNFKYGDVLKDREYRKLLFSNLINRFGDSIDAIIGSYVTDGGYYDYTANN